MSDWGIRGILYPVKTNTCQFACSNPCSCLGSEVTLAVIVQLPWAAGWLYTPTFFLLQLWRLHQPSP